MTIGQHLTRVALLMVFAAGQLAWGLCHAEATFADGLRYIHQAEQIESGSWTSSLVKGIDHPLHPLGISAVHRLLTGANPGSWQRAALLLCFACAVLVVIPIYLLTLDLFGARAAWLACLLVVVNPIIGYIVVNVLSESTFLVFWSFGLWAAVRFLREGRLPWLAPAIGFGAMLDPPRGDAFARRPDGNPVDPASPPGEEPQLVSLAASRRLLAGRHRASGGSVHDLEGRSGDQAGDCAGAGAGTTVAATGAEREAVAPGADGFRDLPPGDDPYAQGVSRRGHAESVSFRTPGAGRGGRRRGTRASPAIPIDRAGRGSGRVLRLHATGGYCTVRHGLAPGVILTMAAAHGITWLIGRSEGVVRPPGPRIQRWRPELAVWIGLIALLVVLPDGRMLGPGVPGPFAVYRATGQWIATNTVRSDEVLDLTDWSLFFSGRRGYVFAGVYDAATNPHTRWIVARRPHVDGHWHYSEVLRSLIGGRAPVALVPPQATPGQVQIQIYDLLAAVEGIRPIQRSKR